jgi:hypothetical protein
MFINQVEENREIVIVELPLAGLYTVILKVHQIVQKTKTNHSTTAPHDGTFPKLDFWEWFFHTPYNID